MHRHAVTSDKDTYDSLPRQACAPTASLSEVADVPEFPVVQLPDVFPEEPSCYEELRVAVEAWWTSEELIQDVYSMMDARSEHDPYRKNLNSQLRDLHIQQHRILCSLSAEARGLLCSVGRVNVDGAQLFFLPADPSSEGLAKKYDQLVAHRALDFRSGT